MEPGNATPLDPLTKVALESLKDIAVPKPVSWLPQTWGWALIAVLLIAVVGAILVRSILMYHANAYRREALTLLDAIEERLKDPAQHDRALRDLAEVLKRTALGAWGRAEVATLSGAAWVSFLKTHGSGQEGHALDALLDDREYQSGASAGVLVTDDILAAARRWIRGHRVSA
ncbi:MULTISPECIES: DUF4381 domain-containing protein [unclassified Rhizobium]|uniref:DUF4381 domain-containing protein n=1 Tax=unclassified Rhizobium TaxID=2613769 RepID=UPI0006FF6E4F|nr:MULTISPECIES: DUF4381 domain-containing protein [unclassified Rhizobium]KQV41744.1 hypothetical protein ASC86_20220 [Rhizobium sp. Root1212]KRD32260.1 hypothetical protein ASE37_22860 [Rhizobium sp. Root268]